MEVVSALVVNEIFVSACRTPLGLYSVQQTSFYSDHHCSFRCTRQSLIILLVQNSTLSVLAMDGYSGMLKIFSEVVASDQAGQTETTSLATFPRTGLTDMEFRMSVGCHFHTDAPFSGWLK